MKEKEILELKKEMETQDNLSTHNPLFVVFDIEKIPSSSDYTSDSEWIWDNESYSEEELKECMKDNDIKFDESNWETVAQIHDIYLCYYIEKRTYQNAFLTRKAAQQFIDQNHYHFSKPFIYVHGMWRNHELVAVRDHFINYKVRNSDEVRK